MDPRSGTGEATMVGVYGIAGSETQEYARQLSTIGAQMGVSSSWARPPKATTCSPISIGGLQVNFQAAIIYIPIVYLIGVTVGLLMGYFGGWFDLVVQRVIEILSNIPFLFLVIIITLGVPAQYKDRLGFYLILAIFCQFSAGWE